MVHSERLNGRQSDAHAAALARLRRERGGTAARTEITPAERAVLRRKRRAEGQVTPGMGVAEIIDAVRARYGKELPTDPDEMDRLFREQDERDAADFKAFKEKIMLGRLPELFRECALPRTAEGFLAHKWLTDYRAGVRRSLVLLGTVGTGKTWYACAVAAQLMLEDSVPVTFTAAEELLDALRPGSSIVDGDMLSLASAPVLVIDDLGTETANDWAARQLYRLANERAQNMRPTIVTSNLTGSEIRARYEARTIERLFSGATLITLTGPSRRGDVPF